jgi:hypothetical protein
MVYMVISFLGVMGYAWNNLFRISILYNGKNKRYFTVVIISILSLQILFPLALALEERTSFQPCGSVNDDLLAIKEQFRLVLWLVRHPFN